MRKYKDLAGNYHYYPEYPGDGQEPTEHLAQRISNADNLPRKYHSWYKLYNEWKELGITDGDRFFHEERIHGVLYTYNFTLEHVKCKCFDEFKSDIFTFDELLLIEISLATSQLIFDKEILNKISTLKNTKFRFGEI